jgi:hypothetical protein
VNLRKDLSAFRVYRREGGLTVGAYLRSLLQPKLVPQVFDRRDVGPWLRAGSQAWRKLRSEMTRKLTPRASKPH